MDLPACELPLPWQPVTSTLATGRQPPGHLATAGHPAPTTRDQANNEAAQLTHSHCHQFARSQGSGPSRVCGRGRPADTRWHKVRLLTPDRHTGVQRFCQGGPDVLRIAVVRSRGRLHRSTAVTSEVNERVGRPAPRKVRTTLHLRPPCPCAPSADLRSRSAMQGRTDRCRPRCRVRLTYAGSTETRQHRRSGRALTPALRSRPSPERTRRLERSPPARPLGGRSVKNGSVPGTGSPHGASRSRASPTTERHGVTPDWVIEEPAYYGPDTGPTRIVHRGRCRACRDRPSPHPPAPPRHRTVPHLPPRPTAQGDRVGRALPATGPGTQTHPEPAGARVEQSPRGRLTPATGWERARPVVGSRHLLPDQRAGTPAPGDAGPPAAAAPGPRRRRSPHPPPRRVRGRSPPSCPKPRSPAAGKRRTGA